MGTSTDALEAELFEAFEAFEAFETFERACREVFVPEKVRSPEYLIKAINSLHLPPLTMPSIYKLSNCFLRVMTSTLRYGSPKCINIRISTKN